MAAQLVQNIQYRRDVMRTLLLIIFLGGFCFSIINVYREEYLLAGLELAYSLYSIALLRIISSTDNLQRWVIAFIVPLFTLILYALYLPATSKSMFVWILTFPIISYLLLGRWVGLWVSVSFISASLFIYHLKFLDMRESINVAESLNVIFSSALMIAFAHVYEKNRENNEVRLLELAGTDSLTGIPNRLKLYESFAQWAKCAPAQQASLSVALIDLDHFKKINDQYGHSVGDSALRHVTRFIQDQLPPNATISRLGGEEFALKVWGASLEQCSDFVDEVRRKLAVTPLIHENKPIAITFSAGIATFGEDGVTLDALLANADKRLYVAKRQGRNQVCNNVPQTESTSNKALC